MSSIEALALIDPRYLKPLPQAMWGLACACCKKVQSRWGLYEAVRTDEGFHPAEGCLALCSICFLYTSEWAKRREAFVRQTILDIETAKGTLFEKAPNGHLIYCTDADDVLGAIALVCRLVEQAVSRGSSSKGI